MFIKPAPNRKVRYPDLDKFLPKEGAEVPESLYWHKCLKQGDVIKVSSSKPKKGSEEK